MSQKDTKRKNSTTMIESQDVPKNTKETIRRLFHYLANQKGKLILIILAALLSCISYATMPLMIGRGIDNLLNALQKYDGNTSILELLSSTLLYPVLLLIVASLASILFSYIQQYIVSSVGENLTLVLRQEVSKKINKLPLSYFDSHKTGNILSLTTNDLEKLSEVMQVGLMQFITSTFTIIFATVTMLILNPILFLVVFISMIACAFATNFVSALSQRYFTENLTTLDELNGKVEELYTGNHIIKVFNQQNEVIESVIALNNKQYKANLKAQFVNYAINPAIRLLNQLGFIATAIIGGMMALGGHLTLGTLQAFLQYVSQLSEPVTQASYVITSLQAAIAGVERVFVLLDEEEEIADVKCEEIQITDGKVTFNHVRFGYTPEHILMKDLSLEVKPNEMVAIVGPTGGGKTTLINLIMRFYELNGGSICIDGIDIKSLPRGILRQNIGMVLQDTWLFQGTVAENISYGKMDATREEIVAAAKAACCHHFIRTLPNGYDTIISSEASTISQGQMQLLTIARAMLTNPIIMILDEATSNVDTRTEVEIQKAMTILMENKTSFVIAHRLSTIKNADLILVVRDGVIVESGTHTSLLAQNGFYASLYYSQFEVTA